MLTDAILSEAAAEAERFLLSIVPENGEPHVFSKRFERKMQKLIRRTDHPVRYQVMRIAAAVVLAIVTLFGAVMAVSPEARAAVAGWVKSTFFEFYEYSNEDKQTNDVPVAPAKYEYHLSVSPKGYRKVQVIDKVDGKMYLYINDSKQILRFSYSANDVYGSKFIKVEDYTQYSTLVNGYSADIYIAINPDETSGIIWQGEDGEILFQISAIATKDELIEIAKTVIKTKQ